MKTIEFPQTGVIDAYKNGTPQERAFIERLIGGKDKLPAIDITERVKSYEDACEVLGIAPISQDEYMAKGVFTPKQVENPQRTYYQYVQDVICEALNEGWEADAKDGTQPKWRPWIEYSGSGFSFDFSDGSVLYSAVGSRLVFREERLSTYFCKEFMDIHVKAL